MSLRKAPRRAERPGPAGAQEGLVDGARNLGRNYGVC